MKIIKTANGQKLILTKTEWKAIGKKEGWTEAAAIGQQMGAAPPVPATAIQGGAQPQNVQPQVQYSLSKSNQWAMSTQDPSIIDFVNRINTGAQAEGTQKYMGPITLIMKSMNGDQTAFQQLKQMSGGQATVV